MRRVAFLHVYAENDPEGRPVSSRFGKDWKPSAGRRTAISRSSIDIPVGILVESKRYATELVRSAPDLIARSGTAIIAALKQATDTIPIVFSVVNDPIGQGFVTTLSRPGGNITGFTFVDFPMIGKWLEMLKEIAPAVRRVTLLFNPNTLALLSNLPPRIWRGAGLSCR